MLKYILFFMTICVPTAYAKCIFPLPDLRTDADAKPAVVGRVTEIKDFGKVFRIMDNKGRLFNVNIRDLDKGQVFSVYGGAGELSSIGKGDEVQIYQSGCKPLKGKTVYPILLYFDPKLPDRTPEKALKKSVDSNSPDWVK